MFGFCGFSFIFFYLQLTVVQLVQIIDRAHFTGRAQSLAAAAHALVCPSLAIPLHLIISNMPLVMLNCPEAYLVVNLTTIVTVDSIYK